MHAHAHPAPESPPPAARRRRVRTSLVAVTALSLLATGAVQANADHQPAAPAKPAPTATGQLGQAFKDAARSGKRVEAVAERTATSTTWANSNGTVTVDYHAAPVRVPNAQGDAWQAVDAGLVRAADGSVRAKAHPGALKLAGKHEGTRPTGRSAKAAATDAVPLLTMGSGAQALTLGWEGPLPAPELDGERAVYRDALPRTDVVVEATRTGAEQYVVLKDRSAAENGTFTLPLKAAGLTARRGLDGSVSFLDKKSGLPVGAIPAPVMWDASIDERSGEHLRRGKVSMQVEQQGDSVALKISADPAFLNDPRTVYPVTVDPALKLGDTFDTFVQQGYGTDQSHATELKLGNNGSGQVARSFLSFPTGSFAGKNVLSASLNLYEYHSWSCSARAWEVWSTPAASTATRWTSQPKWTSKSATSTQTKGFSSSACAAGYVSADTTALVKSWAAKGGTVNHLGLRAADETDEYGWKRFNSSDATSNDPYLSVTYNTKPGTPVVNPPTPGGTSGTTAYVISTTPSFSFRTADADKNALTGSWQLTEGATVVASGTTPSAAAGTTVTVKAPAGKLLDKHTYSFRTRTSDGTDWSDWSDPLPFQVDLAKAPPPPADLPQAPQTGGAETLNPILSGVVTAPNAGTPTAEFVLKDATGAVVGGTPLASVSVESGKRAALEVGDGLVVDGGAYTWQMRACTPGGCSAYTAPAAFTVRVPAAPVQPEPTTVTVPAATDSSVKAGTADTPVTDGDLRVGADGADTTHWHSYLKADLSSLPAGARIVGATLSLDAAGCLGACEAHQIAAHPLNDAWDPATGTGEGLVAAESEEPYAASVADPLALDLTEAVSQWFSDPESDNGFALRAADEDSDTTTGVTYHSSRTTGGDALKPRLRVAYLPATAPGKPTEVLAVPGDKSLVATWNTPEDTGSSSVDPVTYKVVVRDSGTTQVAETTTADRRAAFAGIAALTNGGSYTVEVSAVNAHGTGAAARSALVRPVAAAADQNALKDTVQQFTAASDGLLSGKYATVDAALAASPLAASFETLLRAQGPAILEDRAAYARHDVTYKNLTGALSDAVVSSSGSTAVLRVTRTGTRTEVEDGVDSDPIEELAEEEYVFTLPGAGKPPVLQRVSDDRDVYAALPAGEAARVAVTVESTDDAESAEPVDAPAIQTDADGFSLEDPNPPVQARTSLNRSGAASWAKKHAKDKDEFGTDCTNFVSKALNRGGKMRMKSPGWYRSDNYWWRTYGFLGNQTYSWAASNHLFSFFNKKAKVTWRSYDAQATAGDVVFWKWKRSKPIQHASIVISKSGSRVNIAQHTSKYRITTMKDGRKRNRPYSVWIAHVTPKW
ncbi:DNRLRE domain-containing protein [Streptomyces sp. NPDC091272]|uniref:DNRLRE domain-containing protein n=1 Tax=Streptomyces sp. NPDC091272 TaxID=3365981 RepID=UPI003811B499